MEEQSQRRRILEHVQERYGAAPEHLWARYPDYAVCRHPASRKWFAAFMNVPRNRLGLDGNTAVEVLNVKCGPLLKGSLLSAPGFLPAYHMSKESWISILLDDSVLDNEIFPLLEWSYDSVAPKRRGR